MNKRLPTTTASNAYELLKAVKQAITGQPQAFNMKYWIVHDPKETYGQNPECGTAACLGGWICLLAEGKTRGAGGSLACQILLGASSWRKLESARHKEAYHDLMDIQSDHRRNGLFFQTMVRQGGDGQLLQPGTLEYAQEMADRLDAYAEKYKDILEARPVSPPQQEEFLQGVLIKPREKALV